MLFLFSKGVYEHYLLTVFQINVTMATKTRLYVKISLQSN